MSATFVPNCMSENHRPAVVVRSPCDFVEATKRYHNGSRKHAVAVNSTATGKTDASGDCPSGLSPGAACALTEPTFRRT